MSEGRREALGLGTIRRSVNLRAEAQAAYDYVCATLGRKCRGAPWPIFAFMSGRCAGAVYTYTFGFTSRRCVGPEGR